MHLLTILEARCALVTYCSSSRLLFANPFSGCSPPSNSFKRMFLDQFFLDLRDSSGHGLVGRDSTVQEKAGEELNGFDGGKDSNCSFDAYRVSSIRAGGSGSSELILSDFTSRIIINTAN